jgi:hypothetical protein
MAVITLEWQSAQHAAELRAARDHVCFLSVPMNFDQTSFPVLALSA